MLNGKDIIFSIHALERLSLRGATEAEVIQTIREGKRRPAKGGKFSFLLEFPFNAISPINGILYSTKTIECIVAVESARYVVVTIKVYYGK